MRLLLYCLLMVALGCRPAAPTEAPTAEPVSPIYWIGWSDRPDRHRDNLSFRQRALLLRQHTGGPLLIARDGQQALRLLHAEVAQSNVPRPLVFLGHGDGFGLFMAERNGFYRDTIRNQPELAFKYGGGPRQQFFSSLPAESLIVAGISEALFLSCYSAGVAQEWVGQTGQPAVGALHLVHPVLTADSTSETGAFRSDLPFVRYRMGDHGLLTDTLGNVIDPRDDLNLQADDPQNAGLTLRGTHVQEPDPRWHLTQR
jgi:hypothetical protein